MAIHNAMKKAMVAKVEDDSYLPPPFLSLPEVDCQESGQPIDVIIDAHAESQPQPRPSRADLVGEQDVLSMRGKKILDWAIFHVVEDYLAGMSKAFQKVLRAIFTKIDSRSLETVNKLHGNFTMFLGSAWRTLKIGSSSLLQPLVPVAASVYITESRVFERQANPTRPSSEVSPATTTKSASEYTLLKNIRKLQGPAYKTFSESPPASLPIVTNADSDSAVVDEEDHPSSRSPSPVWSGIQDELPPLPGSVLSLEELEQLISELSLIEEAHGAHPHVLAPTLEELMADLFRLLEWDSTPESTPSVRLGVSAPPTGFQLLNFRRLQSRRACLH
ncbi:hypothetical protein FB451DRAFT_1202069 [Mycena latifolia]|nr:hypothetical protein FB451DRAFT_1202069 [Mycena latifolia]